MKCYLFLCICLFSPLSLLRAQEVYYPDSTSQDAVIKVNWLERFQTKADSVIRHSDLCQTSQTGIYFYNLTADSAIFDYGSRQMMRPASVTKTLTATAALAGSVHGVVVQTSREVFSSSSSLSRKVMEGSSASL